MGDFGHQVKVNIELSLFNLFDKMNGFIHQITYLIRYPMIDVLTCAWYQVGQIHIISFVVLITFPDLFNSQVENAFLDQRQRLLRVNQMIVLGSHFIIVVSSSPFFFPLCQIRSRFTSPLEVSSHQSLKYSVALQTKLCRNGHRICRNRTPNLSQRTPNLSQPLLIVQSIYNDSQLRARGKTTSALRGIFEYLFFNAPLLKGDGSYPHPHRRTESIVYQIYPWGVVYFVV